MLYPSSLASSSVKIKIYIYIGISKKYLLSEISKISDQPWWIRDRSFPHTAGKSKILEEKLGAKIVIALRAD